jgi:hypothetical protein
LRDWTGEVLALLLGLLGLLEKLAAPLLGLLLELLFLLDEVLEFAAEFLRVLEGAGLEEELLEFLDDDIDLGVGAVEVGAHLLELSPRLAEVLGGVGHVAGAELVEHAGDVLEFLGLAFLEEFVGGEVAHDVQEAGAGEVHAPVDHVLALLLLHDAVGLAQEEFALGQRRGDGGHGAQGKQESGSQHRVVPRFKRGGLHCL